MVVGYKLQLWGLGFDVYMPKYFVTSTVLRTLGNVPSFLRVKIDPEP